MAFAQGSRQHAHRAAVRRGQGSYRCRLAWVSPWKADWPGGMGADCVGEARRVAYATVRNAACQNTFVLRVGAGCHRHRIVRQCGRAPWVTRRMDRLERQVVHRDAEGTSLARVGGLPAKGGRGSWPRRSTPTSWTYFWPLHSLQLIDSCISVSPVAPPGSIRQHKQIQTREFEQGEREQRQVAHPDDRLL
jgi:hypothetical protein